MKVAAAIAANPDGGLPQQCGDWGQTQGAYRFFNNPRVEPEAIVQTHAQRTREDCRRYPVILVPQDTTYLDYGRQPAKRGLAPLYTSDQHQGMMQHSALALTPEGQLIGLLYTRCCNRVQVPDGETLVLRSAPAFAKPATAGEGRSQSSARPAPGALERIGPLARNG